MMRTNVLKIAALAAAATLPLNAAAQIGPRTVGGGVYFQGFDFANELQVEAANLVLLPVAVQVPVGSRFNADVYTAYARGSALISGFEQSISGFVDTRVRASYQVTPWALVTVGLNVPTGNAAHDDEEARVAAVLSTELLGFREASWGMGRGVTTGIATAHHVAGFGVGAGFSYRMTSEFEPVADSALKYTPGNEVRVRLALDRNIGDGKLTAGFTFQNYSEDQLDGRDLFQPGKRLRGDLTYAFRSSPTAAWTAYVTDVWRAHGDVFASPARNTANALRVGSQNLLLAGIVGSMRVAGHTVQPALDARLQTREDAGGEGWMLGGGMDVPLRWRGLDITPGAKLYAGALQGATDESHSLFGGELSLALRYTTGR